MIKLKIENRLQMEERYDDEKDEFVIKPVEELECEVEPYDMEKWRDGRIYEFNTLKEAEEFMKTCDIDFTAAEYQEFNTWSWYVMDMLWRIDTSEDNLLVFTIDMHPEWRD